MTHVETATKPPVRRAVAAVIGVVAAVATLVLSRLEPWHGPVIFSFSRAHGLDAGDGIWIPLVLLGVVSFSAALFSPRVERSWPGQLAGPASAIGLGMAMMLVSISALAGRGDELRWNRELFRVDRGLPSRTEGLIAASLVIGAAGCLAVATALDRGRWIGRSPSVRQWGAAWFVVGLVPDALFGDQGTVFGAMTVAAWFALTASWRLERFVTAILAIGLGIATAIAMRGDEHSASRLAIRDGGTARTAAVGLVVWAVGILRAAVALRTLANSTRAVRATTGPDERTR